jgi:hypothetical protein
MSTKLNRKTLRELLRTLIMKELEEASTTVTAGGSTGNGIHYDIPSAFDKKTKSGHKDPEEAGYKKVTEGLTEGQKRDYHNAYIKYYRAYQAFAGETMDLGKTISKFSGDKTDEKLIIKNFKKYVIPFAGLMNSWDKGQQKNPGLNEGHYTQYRNDNTLTAKQKIGISMREVRDKLTELSKLIDMNVKLKNELSVDSKSYWKNTHKAMSKISERLVKLANKVGKLQ